MDVICFREISPENAAFTGALSSSYKNYPLRPPHTKGILLGALTTLLEKSSRKIKTEKRRRNTKFSEK